MARVIVVGSINQDITVTVDRFPSPGETLSGSSLTYGLGGKGANQAAAAAHSGAETLFVGAVGTDLSGQRLRAGLGCPRRGARTCATSTDPREQRSSLSRPPARTRSSWTRARTAR